MNTTADKLNGLKNTKAAIKQAIIDKGVALSNEPFSAYATKIGEITGGGGGGNQGAPKVICYDTVHQNEGPYSSHEWYHQIKTIDWTEYNKLGNYDFSNFFSQNTKGNLDGLINNLDTSSGSTFTQFFAYSPITEFIFSKYPGFKLKNAYSLDKMFYHGRFLKKVDFTGCECGEKLIYMSEVFSNCEELETLNLTGLNTSKLQPFRDMFYYCQKLTNITFADNWLSSPLVKEFDMVGPSYSKNTKYSHESILDLFNKLAIRDNNPVVKLPDVVYDACSPDELAIAQNKGWTVTRV